jgi:hypothetical protein
MWTVVATRSPSLTIERGSNLRISTLLPIAWKNAAVPSRPRRAPNQGTPAGPGTRHSTSSATFSRIAGTSPRPKAAYMDFTVSAGVLVLLDMAVSLPARAGVWGCV